MIDNIEQYREVYRALKFLAGHDGDYATAENGVGFNSGYGHILAEAPFESWSPKMLRAGWEIAQRYKKTQLPEAGINFDSIPVPPVPTAELQQAWRDRKAELAAAKAKAAGEKPPFRGLKLDTPTKYRASEFAKVLVVVTPKDWAVIEDIKALPLRRWGDSRQDKGWEVPLVRDNLVGEDGKSGLVALIKKHNLEVPAICQAAMDEVLAERENLAELSSAAASDFHIDGLPEGLAARPFQLATIEYGIKALQTGGVIYAEEMGLGKSQPLDALVLTPTGWVRMGDIAVGDQVVGSNGKPTTVLGIYPQGERDIFRATFTDGSSVECDDDHLWQVNTPLRKWKGVAGSVKSLREIRGDLRTTVHNLKHFIPMASPVEFQQPVDLVIDPYLMGALIGDGTFKYSYVHISTGDEEMVTRVRECVPAGIEVKHHDRYDWALVAPDHHRNGNPLSSHLDEVGLRGCGSHTKFIPKRYKLSSVEARIALLQGLMDTDGSVSKDGHIEFSTVSEQLAHDVQFLVESLGGCAPIKPKKTTWTYREERHYGNAFRLTIQLPVGINPFRLTRKAEAYKGRTKYQPVRAFKSVEYVGKKQARCILVDAPDHLYLTEHCIVTHNTIDALLTIKAMGWTKTLIVMPANLKLNWEREVRKWLPDYSISVISGKKGPWREAQIVLINQDILTARLMELLAHTWDGVIGDEAHNFKNESAARTKSFYKLAVDAKHRVILLSGTPVTNKPAEFISLLKITGRFVTLFGTWYRFVDRYCNAMRTRFGWDIGGSAHEQELNDKLRSTCYVRHTKKEVLPELPDKVRSYITFELGRTARAKYDRVEQDLLAHVADRARADRRFHSELASLPEEDRKAAIEAHAADKVEKTKRAETLVKIENLKQAAAEGKLEDVKAWITDFLEGSDEKLIVFAWHIEVVDTLLREFKKYGSIGIKGDAQGPVDVRFQSDPSIRIAVLNIKSGGVGLTLTAASNVAFVEYAWTPADMNQAEDRAHRIGQEDSVNVWNLVASNTIEEDLLQIIESKRNVVDAVTEGHEAQESTKVIAALMQKLRRRATGEEEVA